MEPTDDLTTSITMQSQQLQAAHRALEIAEANALRLQFMDALTQIILRHPSMDTLIQELSERIRDVMQVDYVTILRLDAQRQELVMNTWRGPKERAAAQTRIPIGQGIAGRIFVSRQPMVVADLSRADVFNPSLRERSRSLLGVPLMVEDRVIGVIHVSTAQSRHFMPEDVEVLQVAADRIALAIKHAQLLADETRAHQEAEQLAHRLDALQSINDIILQHLNVGELVPALLKRVSEVMHVDNVAILLPAPEQHDLLLYSVFGPEQEVQEQVHVPIGKGVAGSIMACGKPLIIDDLATSNAVNPFLRQRLHSLLGLPLQVEERTIGVIHVSTIQPRTFTQGDQDLLQVVADRIALAIDRTHAFEIAQQARQTAEERAAQLAEVNQRMDSFLGIASHEMRTPLTSVLANIDFLIHRLTGPRADDILTAEQIAFVLPFLQRAQRQAKRLSSLVNDLLDVERIQANHLEIRPTHQDLRPVVVATVEEQRQLAPQRTITLRMPATPLLADIDAHRISQVLTNFLTNALKFSLADQPINVTLRRQGAMAYLSVKDAGPGIAPADRERIWERFHRVDTIQHQSGSYVGVGLGLYISRTIITAHHGRVGVKGRAGRGAEFWCTIPLQGYDMQ
jgi:K+-sensing histidine kinase KdpD